MAIIVGLLYNKALNKTVCLRNGVYKAAFEPRDVRYREIVSRNIGRRHSGVKKAFISVVPCLLR